MGLMNWLRPSFFQAYLLLLPFSLHQSQTFSTFFFQLSISTPFLCSPPVSSPPLFPLYLPCDHLPSFSPPYPSISLSQHLFPAKIRAAFTSCFLLPIFPSLPLWHSKIYLGALHFLTSLTPNWLISFICGSLTSSRYYYLNFDKKPIHQLNIKRFLTIHYFVIDSLMHIGLHLCKIHKIF